MILYLVNYNGDLKLLYLNFESEEWIMMISQYVNALSLLLVLSLNFYLGAMDQQVMKARIAQLVDQYLQPSFFMAAKNGNVDTVRDLINDDQAIDATTTRNFTALHLAALHNRINVATLLIERRANAKVIDDLHQTPLHMAASRGHVEMIQLLIAADPDRVNINAVSQDGGKTPLHDAVHAGRADAVEALIKGGANIEAADIAGRTPLALAVIFSRDSVRDALLSHGAVFEAYLALVVEI